MLSHDVIRLPLNFYVKRPCRILVHIVLQAGVLKSYFLKYDPTHTSDASGSQTLALNAFERKILLIDVKRDSPVKTCEQDSD